MSQTQYIKTIENKIKRLNERIDLKIINGQSYGADSREHKALLRKIAARKQSVGLFGRLFATSF